MGWLDRISVCICVFMYVYVCVWIGAIEEVLMWVAGRIGVFLVGWFGVCVSRGRIPRLWLFQLI